MRRDEATITRWLRKYQDGGYKNLLLVKHAPGKEPIVSGENLERLMVRLSEAEGFQSYSQIQQWIVTELRLDIAYKTVYQLVHYQLGAKLKVPRPKSHKQHPESQSHFKKNSLSRSNFYKKNSEKISNGYRVYKFKLNPETEEN